MKRLANLKLITYSKPFKSWHNLVNLDPESVFEHCRMKYGIEVKRFVMMGMSLGSHPSCHLASLYLNFAGVILMSPLMSLCRIVSPSRKINCDDHFNNLSLGLSLPSTEYICCIKKYFDQYFCHSVTKLKLTRKFCIVHF